MKKQTLWITVAICAICIVYLISAYNSLVIGSQAVSAQWAQVQNVYQRQADLIPNLVATVKGYANHEGTTLEAITEARANAVSQTNINGLPNQQDLNNIDQSHRLLNSAMSRLMVVVENYPDLKANQNFMALQYELAGSENRIAVERQRYSRAVQDYNTNLQRFPNNILANLFGFKPVAYFSASPASQVAPVVKF